MSPNWCSWSRSPCSGRKPSPCDTAAAQPPSQARDGDGCADPGARRILGDGAAEVRKPRSPGQRKPRQHFVLVLQKYRLQVARGNVALRHRKSGTVIGDKSDRLVVMLPEAVQD